MTTLIRAVALALGFACLSPHASSQEIRPVPRFSFDTHWLKSPESLALGPITAVAVDKRDHLWVLHRPKAAVGVRSGAVAAPVVEYDEQGRYLRSFGGPGEGYEWPDVEHSFAVDGRGHVWIGGSYRGNGRSDDMLLEFGPTGRFLRQIGRRSSSQGNFDSANVRQPTDIFIDDQAREVYVSDGYGNQRIIVFDARTGQFRRMWGAFGSRPPIENIPLTSKLAGTDNVQTFIGVHGVEMSRDRLVYVSDRQNQRIQVFTPQGRYLRQVIVNRGMPSSATVSGITFSRDRKQTLLFVADWGNGQIVVIDRKSLSVIGSIGSWGDKQGEFRGPHLLDIDSKGAIYVAEVQGHRVQKLTPEP